ncbi:hypothetical protein [Tsukamurella pulmonis]|nr:hypothetical protein [Tsukamurella pulmonis]
MTEATQRPARNAGHLSARAMRAVAGTGLLAVFGAMTVGGAIYALTGSPTPADPPEPPPVRTVPAAQGPAGAQAPTTEPARVALKAADDSRTMFTLLSNAVTSSTSGLTTAMAGVPQVFDSVATAREGAAEVAAGLDETESASAALDQVSASAQGWSGTIEQLQGLSGMTTSVRTNAVLLRKRLIAQPTPEAKQTIAQLDQVIAATDGFTALETADGLADSVESLSQASASSSASLGRARTAARSLRDGLATIEAAKPQALAAASNLSTGLKQLGIALKSIDAQLALIQSQLRAEVGTNSTPALAAGSLAGAADDTGTRLAWSVSASGAAGMLLSLYGIRLRNRTRTRPAPAEEEAAPLADLARAISEIPTPGQGFPRPDTVHTDPWLPVQFARQG